MKHENYTMGEKSIGTNKFGINIEWKNMCRNKNILLAIC